MATTKITLNELRNIVRQIIKENIDEMYYVITSKTSSPEIKGDVFTITQSEYYDNQADYENQRMWSVFGPYTKEEADRKEQKIEDGYRMFNYYDKTVDDREGISNLYIDPLNKFEKGSLDRDTDW